MMLATQVAGSEYMPEETSTKQQLSFAMPRYGNYNMKQRADFLIDIWDILFYTLAQEMLIRNYGQDAHICNQMKQRYIRKQLIRPIQQ